MRRFAVILLASFILSSCLMIGNLVQDDKIVAEAGNSKLYLSELEKYVPKGIPAEDSTRIALSYINFWAQEKLFNELADAELTKAEKDVTEELEDYKASLLKYRFEQKYVNQRLDTTITQNQVEEYYNAHPESFRLDSPIVKARFLSISPESPSLLTLRKKMASQDPEDLILCDSLAADGAIRWTTFHDRWTDASMLAREFGDSWSSLESEMKRGYIERTAVSGNLDIAYVSETLQAGDQGPVDYYDNQIRDIILNIRKQQLISRLEQDLLDKARSQNKFVIY